MRVAAAALLFLCAHALCACAHGPPAAPRTQLVRDLEGREAHLDVQGRVVLLDVWATWCEPCRATLPIYEQLAAELGPRGLTVVALSIDDEDETVRAFLAKHRPAFVELRDPHGEVADRLGAKLMPTCFLLDRSGEVRFKHEGFAPAEGAQIRAELLELLGR